MMPCRYIKSLERTSIGTYNCRMCFYPVSSVLPRCSSPGSCDAYSEDVDIEMRQTLNAIIDKLGIDVEKLDIPEVRICSESPQALDNRKDLEDAITLLARKFQNHSHTPRGVVSSISGSVGASFKGIINFLNDL